MEFPQQLRTARLLFTRIGTSDRDDFLSLRAHPRVAHALGAAPASASATHFGRHADHWEQHGYGWWAVRDPASGAFLGCGGLEVAQEHAKGIEVAFGFLPEYWGRGYASELVRVAVAQGFVRVGADHFVSFVLAANDRSRHVMEKAGFAREGEVMRAGRPHLLYRLTARAWNAALRPRGSRTPRVGALQTA